MLHFTLLHSFYKYRFLATQELFEDPDFKPIDGSYGNCGHGDCQQYNSRSGLRWMRPKELSNNPKFFADGATRFDVNQGGLGDCWFLASIATLAQKPALFEKVVPRGQSFDRGQYTGAFHFRFWQNEKWIDVIIDDYLPTRDGKLFNLQSDDRNEFWPALLEEAYAKFRGSYKALCGGWPDVALKDLTGSRNIQILDLEEKSPWALFSKMYQASQEGALMICFILGRPNTPEGLGLFDGHAYSITKVIEVRDKTNQVFQLIRVRNPWGDSHEWRGDWNDNDIINKLTPQEKAKHQIVDGDDGEWYMTIKDLLKHFTQITICHLPKPGNRCHCCCLQ